MPLGVKNIYVVGTLIGFELIEAGSANRAFTEVNTSDNNIERIIAFDKSELHTYLKNKGYTSIKPTGLENVYLVK